MLQLTQLRCAQGKFRSKEEQTQIPLHNTEDKDIRHNTPSQDRP